MEGQTTGKSGSGLVNILLLIVIIEAYFFSLILFFLDSFIKILTDSN